MIHSLGVPRLIPFLSHLLPASWSRSSGRVVAVNPRYCDSSPVWIRPIQATLVIGSEPITGPSAERGLVFQDPNLFPWLTVRRNIQVGLVARGVLREKRHEVDEFIRLVGLEWHSPTLTRIIFPAAWRSASLWRGR